MLMLYIHFFLLIIYILGYGINVIKPFYIHLKIPEYLKITFNNLLVSLTGFKKLSIFSNTSLCY